MAGGYRPGKPRNTSSPGRGWSGALPEGVIHVESPTALVWILGRVYCEGTPEDYKAVHELQDQFSSVPLGAYGKPYTPPPGVVDETFDMEKEVRKQVNDLPLAEYFAYLAELLKANPPKPEDAPIVGLMAEIGIVPGQEFDHGKLPLLGHRLDPKLALLELVRAMKDKEAGQRLALLDQRRRRVRHGLRAAGDGHHDRARPELPAGCAVPVLGEGRRTARTTTAPGTRTSCTSRRGRCRRSRGSGC